jgi:hypothetical protein
MAPMNALLTDLLHIFRLDEPEEGSSDNSPLETIRERVGEFFQHVLEHFLHHPSCPPSQPNSSEDTSHPSTPSCGASSGNHQSDDHRHPEDHEGVRDNDGFHRWLGSGMWGDPGGLLPCNLPGVTNVDLMKDEQGTLQLQREAAVADHQAGPNLARLVQAMSSCLGNCSGFESGPSSHSTSDPTPQTTIAAAWH